MLQAETSHMLTPYLEPHIYTPLIKNTETKNHTHKHTKHNPPEDRGYTRSSAVVFAEELPFTYLLLTASIFWASGVWERG